MDIAHFLLGICGNASALFLFLAPVYVVLSCFLFHVFLSETSTLLIEDMSGVRDMITFKRIIVNKSTEKFSGIPYVMTLLNCLLSAWYGLPFVSPHNLLVSTVNGAGAAIEIIYVLIFIIFAPKKEKLKIFGLFTAVLSVFSIVVFVSLFALHGTPRKVFCGFAASIFSVIMYGSPLSIMRLVIKTKSVEFMPFFLSLFVFLCGTSWFIFGLLGRDPFIAVPNGLGSVLGAMQLILYFIYRDKKGVTKKQPPIDEESMEMSNGKTHQMKQSNAHEIQG